MTDVELCPWTLPEDSPHAATLSACVRLPGHEGPHVVGLASSGWCLLYEVNLETRMLDRIVHAHFDGEPTREQMAALLALLDVAREKAADPNTPPR